MDIVYVKVKQLSKEEFEKQKSNIIQEEGLEMPEYTEDMVLAYGIDAETYILGGEEILCWPAVIDKEQQEIYSLTFDEKNPIQISEEMLDAYEMLAYEDTEEEMVNWYT